MPFFYPLLSARTCATPSSPTVATVLPYPFLFTTVWPKTRSSRRVLHRLDLPLLASSNHIKEIPRSPFFSPSHPPKSPLLSRFLLATIEVLSSSVATPSTADSATVEGSLPPSSSPPGLPLDVLPRAPSLLAETSTKRCHRLQPPRATAADLVASQPFAPRRHEGELHAPLLSLYLLVPSPPVAMLPNAGYHWFPRATALSSPRHRILPCVTTMSAPPHPFLPSHHPSGLFFFLRKTIR